MTDAQAPLTLDLPIATQAALIAGARDTGLISGLTHQFYKYPARFSPAFVRAAIQAFTQPADVVLDNHVGGGTTLVEALALGRHAIGVDISTLAEFVATVKTTIFSDHELKRLDAWVNRVVGAVNANKPSVPFANYEELGYYKHLQHPSRWRLRKAIDQALSSAVRLDSERLEAFGRCAVLRTAQWALDGRRTIPTISEFREMLGANAAEMVVGARQLRAAVAKHDQLPGVRILQRTAVGLESDTSLLDYPRPKLVLTSPPYPGVHVLYHRWQVDGRKEAPLPFLIANKLDGAGSSYYTMGDRKYPELDTYFSNIKNSMSSVAALAGDDTIVVQMVAFSDSTWQLPRYLKAMNDAGLQEAFLPMLRDQRDGRLWRSVPRRRWYSQQRGNTPGSQEVVLLHQPRRLMLTRPFQHDHSDQIPPRPDYQELGSSEL